MPQPFKTKIRGNPNCQYYTTSGFANRPKLAVAFGEAMEEFAVCEGTLGTLYLILNNKDPITHYKELISNVNFSQRIKLVRKSASNFDKEDKALILAVTDRAQTASGMRNKIAHCFWGHSPDFPNAVIQTPTNKLLKRTFDKLKKLNDSSIQLESNEEGLMVYEKIDFNNIKKAALDANAPIELLTEYVMSQEPQKANYKRMILSDPQTKKRYDKRFLEKSSACWAKKWLRKINIFK